MNVREEIARDLKGEGIESIDSTGESCRFLNRSWWVIEGVYVLGDSVRVSNGQGLPLETTPPPLTLLYTGLPLG